MKDFGKEKTTQNNTLKCCKVNYIPRLFETMRHTLFKYNIKLISVPSLKLKDLLNAKFVPVRAINRSGVYIIPFKNDNKNSFILG